MLSPLLGKEGIHARWRDAPVAAVQLVGALKAAALTPLADGRRRAMKSRPELSHCEVALRSVMSGLAVVSRREPEEPVPSERQRASGW